MRSQTAFQLRLRSRPAPAAMTIIDAMADPQLFGQWFRDPHTWRTWRAFLRALFGLRLNPFELRKFRQYTGRRKNPHTQAREAWMVVGRRGGKSFITALIAVYLACFRDYTRYLAPGERATVMCLA